MNQHVKQYHFIFTEGAGTVSGRTAIVGGGRDGVGPGVEPRSGRLLVPALHRDVGRAVGLWDVKDKLAIVASLPPTTKATCCE